MGDYTEHATAWFTNATGPDFTGCAVVTADGGRRRGFVYLRDGLVYAAHVDGFRPPILTRLVTAGELDPWDVNQLAAGDPDLRNPGLVEAAITSGRVSPEGVQVHVREVTFDALATILSWPAPSVHLEREWSTAIYPVTPMGWPTVLRALTERARQWQQAWTALAADRDPFTVTPSEVSTLPSEGEYDLAPAHAATLRILNGARTVDEVATSLGMTRHETALIFADLARTGHATVA